MWRKDAYGRLSPELEQVSSMGQFALLMGKSKREPLNLPGAKIDSKITLRYYEEFHVRALVRGGDRGDKSTLVPGVVLIPLRIATKMSMTKSESILGN